MASEFEDDFDEVTEDEFEDDREERAVQFAGLDTPSRQLALRRAFEARRETQEMDAALNYLELDVEDEDED